MFVYLINDLLITYYAYEVMIMIVCFVGSMLCIICIDLCMLLRPRVILYGTVQYMTIVEISGSFSDDD